MRFNPLTIKKFKRFRSIKRGYYSLIFFAFTLLLALLAELLCNSRAIIVKYEGSLYFPTYTAFKSGNFFGLEYSHEVNYRDLKKHFAEQGNGNWLILPPIPYNPYEINFKPGVYGPTAPSWADKHLLGTDNAGRDVLARLFYGYRIAMIFALLYTAAVYVIGVAVGCLMGYFGGVFDLLVQRLIEIWSNIPFLYIVIIVASIVRPNLTILLAIVVAFSWMGMTYYMRTNVYKEKARDYTSAALVLGASTPRVIFHHILPNTISTLVTFMPFTIASAITILTSLDFLGYGLPPPTPSWGELLKRGTDNLSAPWIVSSAFGGMVIILIVITFIGEAIREAFDPKKFTIYE